MVTHDFSYGYLWLLTISHGYLWLLMASDCLNNRCYKLEKNCHKGALGVTSVTKMECYNKWSCQCTCLLKCVWLLMVSHGYPWLLMVTHGFRLFE